MRRMLVAAGCVGVALAVWCVGCSQKPKHTGKIGVTCMDLTNPFFKLIANVMQEEAAKHGYQVVALSADLDPAKQNNQMSDFVAQGYDAIFLNPADSKSAGEGVKKAHAAGIPVFTYDVDVSDEEAKNLVISHIGSDNYQGGQLAGESMMKATGDKGKVAIIGYPEAMSAFLRAKGFRDYLTQHQSKLEIVAELSGKGNRNDGYAVATDLLQAHPDIVGIFAVNDPSGLGAYAALAKAAKTNQIAIVAFDASPAGKQAVFERKLYDSPQQFPRQMAAGTVDALMKYVNGEKMPKIVYIPCKHYYFEDSEKDPSRIAEQW